MWHHQCVHCLHTWNSCTCGAQHTNTITSYTVYTALHKSHEVQCFISTAVERCWVFTVHQIPKKDTPGHKDKANLTHLPSTSNYQCRCMQAGFCRVGAGDGVSPQTQMLNTVVTSWEGWGGGGCPANLCSPILRSLLSTSSMGYRLMYAYWKGQNCAAILFRIPLDNGSECSTSCGGV